MARNQKVRVRCSRCRYALAVYKLDADGSIALEKMPQEFTAGPSVVGNDEDGFSLRYEWKCRCGRSVKVNHDKLGERVKAALNAGLREVIV
jgi:hypothetical protein